MLGCCSSKTFHFGLDFGLFRYQLMIAFGENVFVENANYYFMYFENGTNNTKTILHKLEN